MKAIECVLGLKTAHAKAEFWIESGIARAVLAERGFRGLSDEDEVGLALLAARTLGIGALAVCPEKSSLAGLKTMEGLTNLRRVLDFGLEALCLVPGGFTRLVTEWGLGETLALCHNRPAEARELISALGIESLESALPYLQSGACALVLGEDIAYERGLYLTEAATEDIILRGLERIVATCPARVIFHSDGDISSVLTYVAEAGVSGIHSLEETGAMSLDKMNDGIAGAVALFGGFADRVLRQSPRMAIAEAERIAGLFSEVPYCFGTSSGIISDGADAAAVIAAHRAYDASFGVTAGQSELGSKRR